MATYPKDDCCTKMAQTSGSKTVKCVYLQPGQAADIGPAPTSRVYSRDYSKQDPDSDQGGDTLSEFLGNPLRW